MLAIQNTEDPSRWWTGKTWGSFEDRQSYQEVKDLPDHVQSVLDPVYAFDDLYLADLYDEDDNDLFYADREDHVGIVKLDLACAWCKRMWNGVEWIESPRPPAPVNDGMCQDCYDRQFPEDSSN